MEILFRGFHEYENGTQIAVVNGKEYKGEWVYGTPIYPKGYDKVIITTGELAVPNAPNFGFVQYEVIPETVGQYIKSLPYGDKVFSNSKMEIKLYNQDNLILLKNQPDNSIDCIYCDILFNTGKIFNSFSDRLGTPQQAIDFYRPRFLEMKRVLKNTGVIYIHCDYNLSHYIKILLDEIFGISNFRNEIVWYFNSAPRKKKDFGKRHNIIFRYSKTDNYYFNENSKYIRQPYSETAPRGYGKEKYYNPLGKILDDVWKINSIGQNDKTERVGYDTQKPKELLYPIIDSSCPKDGVFADFFCGSGTSLIVAKELGIQKIIGCDINKNAVKISHERLKNIKSFDK